MYCCTGSYYNDIRRRIMRLYYNEIELTDNPCTTQERLATPTGSTSSTQFLNCGVGFLLRPTIFVLISEV